jgi:tetratricopeptide (TPR) repeat protein
LGTSYELQGVYTKALTNHLEAVTLDLAQTQFLVMDHNNVASVYMALGEDWLAWQHIQEAWAMTPTKPLRLIQAVILGNLANIARELGDFPTAVTHLLTAQKTAGILGSRENEIWLATRASTLYRQKGDIIRARQWASYAWQESQIINHPRCAVEAAMECFRLALLEDKPLAAEQWIQQLGELLTINELGRYQGVVLLLHALNLLQNSDVKAAEEIAHGGMQIVQERNEHRYLSFAHALTSLIALQQRDMRAADRHLMCAHQALHERASKLSDLSARERFLQATPFRICLNAREYPSLAELFQYG